MAEKRCIVCGAEDRRVVFRETGVDILRCRHCGHVFSAYEAEQEYDGYFGYDLQALQDDFWWGEAHGRMYNDFCRRFIAGRSGRLLDIGCGVGYFVKKIGDFPSWEVAGYEISETAVAFAREKLGLINVFQGNILDSGIEPQSLDFVTMWDVIEHIPDPDPILSFTNRILKKGGYLFLHTPNVKIQLAKAKLKKSLGKSDSGVHYLEARDHVNIYSMGTLRKVLVRNGFEDNVFTHLRPIQSVSGGRSRLPILIKNLWWYSAVAVYHATAGRVNLDNLFVLAKR